MKINKKAIQGKGIITNLITSKGFGFIRQDDGTDLFFHANGVCDPQYADLKEGYTVEYMIVEVPKGLKAIGIVAV